MNTSVFGFTTRRAAAVRATYRGVSPVVWRTVLLVACACAIAVAFVIGDPSGRLQADPELAQLLRGMAVIKSLLVVAAVALLAWRFSLPIVSPIATGYVAGTALVAGATMSIWQLSFIVPAAAVFHVAALMLLLLAWRDDGVKDRFVAWRR